MVRKGLSYPIPITEERKQAKEQAAAELDKPTDELSLVEEGESNPSDEA